MTRFGSPPVAGSTQTTERLPSAGSWLALLIPIIVPSNDSTWSLLLRVTDPVLNSATALVAKSNVHSLPLPLKISVLPSLVQFGAWIEIGDVCSTVRCPVARSITSRLLPM